MLNYHSSEAWNKKMAFCNPEVIVTTYGDKRLAAFNGSACIADQEERGPTYLAIRSNATDDQLNWAANRFDLPINDLKAFRDNLAR